MEVRFCTSWRYGYNPQYTVTFNRKDYLRYAELYPEIDIYWYVHWKNIPPQYAGYANPMRGVWMTEFWRMSEVIESGSAYLHAYKRRENDQSGNARDSYLFDLDSFWHLGMF